MNLLNKYVLMLVMTVAAGASAIAADTVDKSSGDGHAMGSHKMTPEKMREHTQMRQTTLHDQLKLTPAQEPAWKTYVAAATPTDMGKRWSDHGAMEKMSAPERLEKHIAISKERDARMTSHLAALKTFYAVLTLEQQQIFNKQTMYGGKHGHHHEGHDKNKG